VKPPLLDRYVIVCTNLPPVILKPHSSSTKNLKGGVTRPQLAVTKGADAYRA
jgi:hypothetical protein